jgi:Xaa-Pro aminopeptidase
MVFSEETLHARRQRVARALALQDEVLVVAAGEPIPLPEGTDQTYPFRSHAEYFYLTGVECARGVVTYDPAEGWRSFVPTVSEDERIWEGRAQTPGELIEHFPAWLRQRAQRVVVNLGARLPEVTVDASRQLVVRERFHHARRAKDAAEIALLRQAAAATAAGYNAIQSWLRPGVTERELQIELEAAFRRAGADRTGYGTIVGTGSNSAVLHFESTTRATQSGEWLLIDAGAEVSRYVCDVTRTYGIGAPPSLQRELYQLVRAAEEAMIAKCRAGAEWKELHLQAAVTLTAGLVDAGIMRGEAESLVEQDAHRLFFPHGLGHLVGLGVRDASGTAPGRPKDPRPALKNLRTDLPLEPGFVITVEPGVYFIPPLLQDPERRARYRTAVNWDLVDRHLDAGGIRIEDNVLVTEGEPEVLTAQIPKELNR